MDLNILNISSPNLYIEISNSLRVDGHFSIDDDISYDSNNVNRLIASNLKLSDSELICSHFPNLIILCLSFNKIKDISHISNLYHIEVLDISHNKISSLKPLECLTSLRCLKCQNNNISELGPISNLINMEELWISNNSFDWFQFIYLLPLFKLKSLFVYGNIGVAKPKSYELLAGICCKLECLDGNAIKSHDFLNTPDGRILMAQARQSLSSDQRKYLNDICTYVDRLENIESTLHMAAALPPRIKKPEGSSCVPRRFLEKKKNPQTPLVLNNFPSNHDPMEKNPMDPMGTEKNPIFEKNISSLEVNSEITSIGKSVYDTPPTIIRFGSVDSSPVALQLNSDGTGFTRWSKSGLVACSYETGRLFASHKNGSMAALFDQYCNGSVMNPKGTCLLSLLNNNKNLSLKLNDNNGNHLKSLSYNNNVSSLDSEFENFSDADFTWNFDGIKIKFNPLDWELIVTIKSSKLTSEFSSKTGGKLLSINKKDVESIKKSKIQKQEALLNYDHDGLRGDLKSVMLQLDEINKSLK